MRDLIADDTDVRYWSERFIEAGVVEAAMGGNTFGGKSLQWHLRRLESPVGDTAEAKEHDYEGRIRRGFR